MRCSNCFNGCTEITSDQCVKYTGNDIPALGIETGDTLAQVELAITNFILTLSTGEGIIPIIDNDDLCALVSGFLPESGDITLNQVISVLVRSICNLETRIEHLEDNFQTLNADYNVECLAEEGVSPDSGTHDILQEAINKICSTGEVLTAFILDVTTNYVQLADLNQLIQDYLDNIAPSNLQKNKMVPYVAYEYYGPTTGFDITGAGSGEWIDVYLCNGNNGTPDKRGRVAVGATTGMGGGAMNVAVNPGGGNPNYTLGFTTGTNTVSLDATQIPDHTHTATATSTADPHSHFIAKVGPQDGDLTSTGTLDTEWDASGNFSYRLKKTAGTANVGITSNSTVNVTTSVVVGNTGGGLGHSNIQPSIGAYYIMYIP